MRIVIDIDDNLYTRLFDNGVDNYDDAVDMAKAIRKGTSLPKGCGRLIDANAYFNDVKKHYFDNITVMSCTKIALDNAPTILDADGETNNEDSN